eukprot:TRINITY_DN17872_c0_g2_i1.p1 TRINITY_DN17872_c0_g2~~TRINITY_DN17872_c0_g2_i1.p1  ORF type:complete len:669 (+),score=93.02 TRINITY_DN17872_c0_g2_i1:147-2153(+)
MAVAMVLAPAGRLAAGCCVYLLAWATMALEHVPVWPRIGRPASMLVCAALAVVTGAVGADAALEEIGKQVDMLVLLYSMMLIAVYVDSAGLADRLGDLLAGAPGSNPSYFLIKVTCSSAILSALITNDVTCMFLTPVVVRKCRAKSLPTVPFVLAVCTASNIGSACTPIGSPQNMIVHFRSGVPFSSFASRLLLPTVLALAVDVAFLLAFFRIVTARSWRDCLRGRSTTSADLEVGINATPTLSIASDPLAGASQSTHSADAHGDGIRSYPLDLGREHVTGLGALRLRRDSGILVSIGVRSSYRHPHELRKDLVDSGMQDVPDYLLSPKDSRHEPPHLVTSRLRIALVGEVAAIRAIGARRCLVAVEESAGQVEKLLEDSFDDEALAAHLSPKTCHRGIPPHVVAVRLEEALARARLMRSFLEQQCDGPAAGDVTSVPEGNHEADGHQASPADSDQHLLPLRACLSASTRRRVWAILVLATLVVMISGFVAGLNMAFVAVAAASALLMADGNDARKTFRAVDAEVIIFFASMFVAVAALTGTGLPTKAWTALAPRAVMSSSVGAAVTAVTVVVLSNLAGNVPVVLLLSQAGFVESQSGMSSETAWLALAWLSCLAGNLSPPGSVANAIAADAARAVGGRGPSVLEYMLLGVPLAVTSVAAGLPLLLNL